MSDAEELRATRRRTLGDVIGVLAQLDDRIDRLEKWARQIDSRLLLVDVLPDSAPFGALIRVRGDQTGALYMGNGPSRPITKLVPVLA